MRQWILQLAGWIGRLDDFGLSILAGFRGFFKPVLTLCGR